VHGLARGNGGVGGNECSCGGDACCESTVVSSVAKLRYVGVITRCAVSIVVLQDLYMLCVTPEIVSWEW
jgi:hypothetical protein